MDLTLISSPLCRILLFCSHWYVSGYTLGFENPQTELFEDLFTDVDAEETMFRIVVKSNLTLSLAEDLTKKIEQVLTVLDSMDKGYESVKDRLAELEFRDKNKHVLPLEHSPSERRASRATLHRRSVMATLHTRSTFKSTFLKTHTKIVTQDVC